MSSRRERTVEEILARQTCYLSEAARVLGIGFRQAKALIVEDGRVHSFPVGEGLRVSVPSLRRFIDPNAPQP